MKENNKQLAINMIAKIIAFVVNFGISFFLTPFIVKTVGAEAYGFVGLANNFINYAQIVTVALNSMAGRFITINIHQENYENTNKYMTSVFFSNILLSIPLTILSIVVVANLDQIFRIPMTIVADVKALWALLFSSFIMTLIASVFGVATFARNRLDLSSKREIESNIIRAVFLVLVFSFCSSSIWYLGMATLLCGIYTIITNIYFTRKLLPTTKIQKKYIDIQKIKDLLSAGIWNSVSKLGSTLSTGLDLLITNLLVSSAAMGTVSIAKNLPTYILSIFSMLSSVFMPQLTISYARDDYESIKKQINSSIRLLSFFSSIPVACLLVWGKEFYALWVPEQNAHVLQILSILVAGAFPFVLALEPLWNIFTVTNKVKQSSLFLLMNAFASTIGVFWLLRIVESEFVKMCVVVGVSTAFSIVRGVTFLPIYGARCLGFKWYTFYPAIIRNIIATALTIIVSLGIKCILLVNTWLTFFIAIGGSTVCACVINYFVMLKKEEKFILKKKIHRR